MADPLNVAAGVITVVSLAYSSSRELYELISTIHGSPSVFKDLSEEVITLNQILDTLRASLGDHASMIGDKQIAYLEAVDRTLQGCDVACQDFKAKLEKLTENSSDGKRSFRDGLKLSFQRKNINDFRMRIASWKASLTLGLYVATLTPTSINWNTLEALQNSIIATEVQISADLNRVNSRLEQLLTIEPEGNEEIQISIRRLEEQQQAILSQCIPLYQAAANEATHTAGHSFRKNKAEGDARAVYGNIGNIPTGSATHNYDDNYVGARGRVVMGNMDGADFLAFMK